MGVLTGDQIVQLGAVSQPLAINGGGVDLSVDTIAQPNMTSMDALMAETAITIDDEERVLVDWVNLNWAPYPNGVQSLRLISGIYRVTFQENIRIPADCIGLIYPRSSLLRAGAHMPTAVWDPGYHGKGFGLLEVLSLAMVVQRGVRVCQLVLYRLEGETDRMYSGRYQGEGIS